MIKLNEIVKWPTTALYDLSRMYFSSDWDERRSIGNEHPFLFISSMILGFSALGYMIYTGGKLSLEAHEEKRMMAERIMQYADKNHDQFIDLEEETDLLKRMEYKRRPHWKEFPFSRERMKQVLESYAADK